jgi:DNA-binding transcriptional regulator YiaG
VRLPAAASLPYDFYRLFVPQRPEKRAVVANSNYRDFGILISGAEKGGVLNPTVMWNFRKRHNLTVPQLAEVLGVHKSQVSRWETSQRKIPLWVEKFLTCLDATLPKKASTNPESPSSVAESQ